MSGRAPEPLQIAAEAGRRGARLVSVCRPGSPLADVTARARGTVLHVPRAGLPGVPPAGLPHGPVVAARPRPARLRRRRRPRPRRGRPGRRGRRARRARPRPAGPRRRPSSTPPRLLAAELDGSVPVVLSDGDAAHAAAARAVSMLARAARVPAVRGTLPDDAERRRRAVRRAVRPAPGRRLRRPVPRRAGRGRPCVCSCWPTTRTPPHAGPVRAVAGRAGVRVSDLAAPGGRPLERFAFLVARTDFAATYLALGNRVDPSRSSHLADLRDVWSRDRPAAAPLSAGARRVLRQAVAGAGKPWSRPRALAWGPHGVGDAEGPEGSRRVRGDDRHRHTRAPAPAGARAPDPRGPAAGRIHMSSDTRPGRAAALAATATDRRRPRRRPRRRRPLAGRERPPPAPPGRARDARPHVPARGVRRQGPPRRRPHHRLAAHDRADRRAHRDPRLARRRRPLGLLQHLLHRRRGRRGRRGRPRRAPPRPPPASRSTPGRARRSRSTGGAPTRCSAGPPTPPAPPART